MVDPWWTLEGNNEDAVVPSQRHRRIGNKVLWRPHKADDITSRARHVSNQQKGTRWRREASCLLSSPFISSQPDNRVDNQFDSMSPEFDSYLYCSRPGAHLPSQAEALAARCSIPDAEGVKGPSALTFTLPLVLAPPMAHNTPNEASPSTASLPPKLVLPITDYTGDIKWFKAKDCLAHYVFDRQYTPNELFPFPQCDSAAAKTPTWWIYSSCNIRTLPVFQTGKHRVRGRKNGHCGLDDRSQHPQLIVKGFEWAPCIPRRSEKWWILWWTPTTDDAPIVEGNSLIYNVRVLKTSRVEEFKIVMEECKSIAASTFEAHPKATLLPLLTTHCDDCLERLTLFGLVFRDIVFTIADLQRSLLDILGITNHINIYYPRLSPRTIGDTEPYPVDTSIMGGITDSLAIMQSYVRMGVPMALIRPQWAVNPSTTKIFDGGAVSELVKDQHLVEEDYEELGVQWPFDVIWDGFPCSEMHERMQKIGFRIVDVSASSRRGWDRMSGSSQPQNTTTVYALPPNARIPSSVSKLTETQERLQPFLYDGHRPTLDPNAESPPQIPVWETAIQLIDKSNRPKLPADSPYKAFRLPPPGSLPAPYTSPISSTTVGRFLQRDSDGALIDDNTNDNDDDNDDHDNASGSTSAVQPSTAAIPPSTQQCPPRKVGPVAPSSVSSPSTSSMPRILAQGATLFLQCVSRRGGWDLESGVRDECLRPKGFHQHALNVEVELGSWVMGTAGFSRLISSIANRGTLHILYIPGYAKRLLQGIHIGCQTKRALAVRLRWTAGSAAARRGLDVEMKERALGLSVRMTRCDFPAEFSMSIMTMRTIPRLTGERDEEWRRYDETVKRWG
ncbi:hypothetical protein NMY22_g9847 [Coprinellus aureogranulatus]|nr:hypothetical protein NMY22_g9847 [Coprinellus aureogranulatus]